MGRAITRIIGVGLALTTVALVAWWHWQFVPQQLVRIDAAQDLPEMALPVYAQFVVTQTFTLSEPAEVTQLILPLWSPAAGRSFTVVLKQEETVLATWPLVTREVQRVEEVSLPLPSPRLVSGELKMIVSAAEITHQERHLAPRLFIESAGDHYPAGSYFIATNQKSGDVSVMVMGQARRYQSLLESWRAQPLLAVQSSSAFLLILLVLMAAPGRLVGLWHRHFRRAPGGA